MGWTCPCSHCEGGATGTQEPRCLPAMRVLTQWLPGTDGLEENRTRKGQGMGPDAPLRKRAVREIWEEAGHHLRSEAEQRRHLQEALAP